MEMINGTIADALYAAAGQVVESANMDSLTRYFNSLMASSSTAEATSRNTARRNKRIEDTVAAYTQMAAAMEASKTALVEKLTKEASNNLQEDEKLEQEEHKQKQKDATECNGVLVKLKRRVCELERQLEQERAETADSSEQGLNTQLGRLLGQMHAVCSKLRTLTMDNTWGLEHLRLRLLELVSAQYCEATDSQA
jgi:hypothetical protein